MSYRDFKRLFGETSLERKCRFLLGAVSLLLITASFWTYARLTVRIAYNATTNSGRLLVPLILRNLHDEELESKDAMEEFQKLSEERWSRALSTYTFNLIKPNARQPKNSPDPDETGLLENFLRDPEYNEESRQQSSGDSFVYYGA